MTNENDTDRINRLLREAEALQTQTQEGQASADAAKKSGNIISDAKAVKEAARNINSFVRVCKNVGGAIYKVGKPVFDVAIAFGRGYMKVWNKICYKTDKETGDKNMVRWRAGAMAGLSLFAASGVVPGMLGQPSREAVWSPITDGIAMALPGSFKSNETLYLSNAQEIGGEANEFGVRGCRSLDCSDGGVNFRVRQSGAHTAWALLARGNPFYVSDAEVQTITPGTNVCTATSYGYRNRFFQAIDMYPTLLTAQCEPVFNGVAQRGPATAETAPASTAAVKVSASANFRQ